MYCKSFWELSLTTPIFLNKYPTNDLEEMQRHHVQTFKVTENLRADKSPD